MSPRYALLVALSAALLGACASAEGAYRDGMDHEVAGDYAAAAEAYVRALERDPSLANVPGRLGVAGREAVRTWLAQAAASGPEAAAGAYLAADALVRRAAGVGVDIDRPATFAADRDAALDAAVVDLADRAAARLDGGDYGGALGLLGRARAFRPTPAQAAALDRIAADAHVGWAEADLDAGRFRAALGRTEAALALGPAALADPEAVYALQAAILDAGTLVAAVLPASDALDDLPRGWLREVDDVVADEARGAGRAFLAYVDPAEVRRYLRDTRGWDDGRRGRVGGGPARPRTGPIDSPRRIAEAARGLGADFGVAVEVGPLTWTETEGEPRDERARLRRGGGSTTYQRRRVRLQAEAALALLVVDAGGRIVCEDESRERVSEEADRATYSGDWRELDLSRRERAMFAEDPLAGAEDRALDRLRDVAAGALADRIARCLERQVP